MEASHCTGLPAGYAGRFALFKSSGFDKYDGVWCCCLVGNLAQGMAEAALVAIRSGMGSIICLVIFLDRRQRRVECPPAGETSIPIAPTCFRIPTQIHGEGTAILYLESGFDSGIRRLLQPEFSFSKWGTRSLPLQICSCAAYAGLQ